MEERENRHVSLEEHNRLQLELEEAKRKVAAEAAAYKGEQTLRYLRREHPTVSEACIQAAHKLLTAKGPFEQEGDSVVALSEDGVVNLSECVATLLDATSKTSEASR